METSPNRLPPPLGMLVNHDKPVSFRFESSQYTGLAGDTIASALAANDTWLLSRSFKYHRPRGVFSMAGLEANTLVQVGYEPNVAADKRKITSGLEVTGQNYSGSLANDRAAKIGWQVNFFLLGSITKHFSSLAEHGKISGSPSSENMLDSGKYILTPRASIMIRNICSVTLP